MGVTKQTITPGNGVDRPKKGDTITMEYTGNLYDENAANNKGKQYALTVVTLLSFRADLINPSGLTRPWDVATSRLLLALVVSFEVSRKAD